MTLPVRKGGHVLITGASRGIGAACAVVLAKSGFDLVLWARSESELLATRERCAKSGVVARAAVVDVSDDGSVFGPGAESLAGLPSLRGCVINAGMGIWGRVTDMSADEWRAVLATNLDGAFYSLKVSLPLLLKNPHGQIVTMGSDSSLTGYVGRGAYCGSKTGLQGFLAAVRRETRSDGIRITNLVMSRVDTHFRSKKPGSRPDSLSADDIARVVEWLFLSPPRIEVREIQLSAITDLFGPYPEVAKETR